jgi:hypothetical protein
MFERMGHSFSMVISGGVIMVEVSKRVHAPSGPGLREAVRKPLSVLAPNPAKEPKPV